MCNNKSGKNDNRNVFPVLFLTKIKTAPESSRRYT